MPHDLLATQSTLLDEIEALTHQEQNDPESVALEGFSMGVPLENNLRLMFKDDQPPPMLDRIVQDPKSGAYHVVLNVAYLFHWDAQNNLYRSFLVWLQNLSDKDVVYLSVIGADNITAPSRATVQHYQFFQLLIGSLRESPAKVIIYVDALYMGMASFLVLACEELHWGAMGCIVLTPLKFMESAAAYLPYRTYIQQYLLRRWVDEGMITEDQFLAYVNQNTPIEILPT